MGALCATADAAHAIAKTPVRRTITWAPNGRRPKGDSVNLMRELECFIGGGIAGDNLRKLPPMSGFCAKCGTGLRSPPRLGHGFDPSMALPIQSLRQYPNVERHKDLPPADLDLGKYLTNPGLVA